MTATFWIETIEHTIVLPTPVPNQPLHIQPKPAGPGPVAHLVPTFMLTPPHGIAAGHTIKLRSTQIQYTQTVFLNFNRLRCAGAAGDSRCLCPHSSIGSKSS